MGVTELRPENMTYVLIHKSYMQSIYVLKYIIYLKHINTLPFDEFLAMYIENYFCKGPYTKTTHLLRKIVFFAMPRVNCQ